MPLSATRFLPALCLAALLGSALPASALERICDVAHEDCRAPLIDLINRETVGIDVSFWFMEDTRYSQAILNRWNAGVPVRVLMDTQANADYPGNVTVLNQLRTAGIPMREKTSPEGILHWKLMLFVGQNTVEFSGANYSSEAFVPITPYANYVDEVIYFTDRPEIVNSFKTRYDDAWTDTVKFTDYANVVGTPARKYPTYPIDPSLNFVPWQSFANRSTGRYNAEPATGGIDAIMYRITDRRHSDALIAAMGRGVQVRLISEPQQYRDATRLWDAWNVDRLHAAGAQVRMRAHQGLSHEKLTLLRGQGLVVFGSSNWTSASSDGQHEHNIFTTDPVFFNWSAEHFDRKWNNTAPGGIQETAAFTPLPPDRPTLVSPTDAVTNQSTTLTLRWYAGPWAHKYDVLLGTDPASLTKVVDDRELGPSQSSNDYRSWSLTNLTPGTTYYWRIVSRTMAGVTAQSSIWSFSTEGTAPPPPTDPGLPSGWYSTDIGAVAIGGSATATSGTFTLQGSGADIWGTADAFRFVYQPLSGDGSVVARVSSLTNTDSWTKAGVMIRAGLTAGSAHGSMFVSAAKGLVFQRRTATGGISTSTAGGSSTAPYWVRISRSGSTVTAEVSSDGAIWRLVGTDTIAFPTTIYVGLALTSHNNSALATGTFSDVGVTGSAPPPPPPPPGLPSGWAFGDVGAVGATGGGSESNGTFTVRGAGADVWGTADAFGFASTTLTGNGSIVARVATVQNVNAWTKAGVMMRDGLTSGAAHAFMLVTPTTTKGLAFQRRPTSGGTSVNTAGPLAGPPYWVRLTRTDTVITAEVSSNGSTWTTVGSQTFASLSSTLQVGLAVSSHVTGTLATATFDDVVVTAAP